MDRDPLRRGDYLRAMKSTRNGWFGEDLYVLQKFLGILGASSEIFSP